MVASAEINIVDRMAFLTGGRVVQMSKRVTSIYPKGVEGGVGSRSYITVTRETPVTTVVNLDVYRDEKPVGSSRLINPEPLTEDSQHEVKEGGIKLGDMTGQAVVFNPGEEPIIHHPTAA